MRHTKSSKAFSLLELSVVIIIIAIIILGAILGKYLLDKSRLTNARALTQSSPVLSIDNGPVIWYESSLDRSFNSTQQVNGMAISGWFNITNNATTAKIDASQSTSNNQPTYANTINSVPAVRFDGTNSYFNFDGSFLNNSDYTIFVVEARESNKADNYFFGDNAVTTTNQNLVLGYSANNQVIHKQGSGNTYTSNIAPYDTNHSPKIFTFIQDTNNGKNTYVNSYHTGTSNDATQLQNIGTVTLAKSYQGQIGELIIFPRALTNNERQDVELYLANKWSIDTPLKNASNASSSTDCTSGTLIGNVCDSGTCNVAITGISTTTVSNGSGSLSCSTGYTGGPVTYTCSHSALSSSGSCSAVTCSITSQTGLANQSGLAYTTTPTSLTCQTGYSGSPTYTCTSAGAATISGSCTAITCSITSQTGLPNQSGLSYASSATAIPGGCSSGYSGSPTYTCTTTGAATIVSGCTASTCSISVTGVSSPSTVNSGTGTLYCNATGYNNASFSYNCSGGTTITGSNCNSQCASGYYWNGSQCLQSCNVSATGISTTNTTQGTNIPITCGSGYTGTVYFNCSGGSNWSVASGSCTVSASYRWTVHENYACNGDGGSGWNTTTWTCDASNLGKYLFFGSNNYSSGSGSSTFYGYAYGYATCYCGPGGCVGGCNYCSSSGPYTVWKCVNN